MRSDNQRPTITLRFDANGLDPWMIGETLAVMLYPQDETSREEWFTMQWANWVKVCVQDAPQDIGSSLWQSIYTEGKVPIFIQGLQSTSRVHERAMRAAIDGAVAGDMLLYMMALEKFEKGYGTVIRTKHVLVEAAYKHGETYGGRPLQYRNRDNIEKAWSNYTPVAHFWAAFRFRDFMREQSTQPMPSNFESEDAFLSFLLFAEAFRRFGETHIPHSRQTPTLDPEKTWIVNRPLSQPFPPVGIDLPPLWDMLPHPSDHLKSVAQRYRAPKPW